MEIVMLNRNVLRKEFLKEFHDKQVYTNYLHIRILAIILFLLDLVFLFVDHNNYQRGLWNITPAYRWLFYSHIALGLGMIIITLLYGYSSLKSEGEVRKLHKVYEIIFVVYCIVICALISGWIDQKIHGQLTVYIIGCFIMAVFFSLSPKVSLSVYLLSYIIIMIGITRNQTNLGVLYGHYLNIMFLIIIAWFLSVILYKSRIQDFVHVNHLERLVQERTKDLEGINQQLIREVNERNLIEEKIFRLASIVESTDDGIIGMDLEGIVIDWNKGAEVIYGYRELEIIGLSVGKLFPSDRQTELDNILLTISEGKSIPHHETTRQRKDGQVIYVHLTVSPIKNHKGKIMGASTIVRDVTSRKRIEKEMTRMDQMNLVGEMAASIGHEVRNPMTTVRGFLQLLGESNNFDKYRNYIPLMISELDRANQIIGEFLSISRTKVTEFAVHNLNIIIKSILPLIEVDAIRSFNSVTTQLTDIPDLSLNDKEMRQLILNLARNGLEAMDKGGLLIIKTFCINDEVILAIEDSGKGIRPEVMDKLGTPFFTTKETGTGLGLAVCYGIAARHNAIISFETSSKGTIFFMKFKTSK